MVETILRQSAATIIMVGIFGDGAELECEDSPEWLLFRDSTEDERGAGLDFAGLMEPCLEY